MILLADEQRREGKNNFEFMECKFVINFENIPHYFSRCLFIPLSHWLRLLMLLVNDASVDDKRG